MNKTLDFTVSCHHRPGSRRKNDQLRFPFFGTFLRNENNVEGLFFHMWQELLSSLPIIPVRLNILFLN